MKLVTEDKVVLSSVGCVIDKSTGITFPIHSDDTIDWDGGTHIYDIENEEWFWFFIITTLSLGCMTLTKE